MKLPDYQRVIYGRTPLIEVVGQLHFNTILKISNQEPFEFQEKIKSDYPIFQQSQSLNLPPEVTALLTQIGSLGHFTSSYNFLSENSKWQVSLTRNTLSLATFEYKRYEEFKDKFIKVIEVFEDIYKPSFYIRLGLRYRDLILRSKLNIEDKEKPWSELISPKIAYELHSSEWCNSINTLTKNLEINLPKGKVNFNHGLVTAQDNSKSNSQEIGYLFDADFFIEGKINKEEIWNDFNKFNQIGGKLFRWSITEELHQAMEPQSIIINQDWSYQKPQTIVTIRNSYQENSSEKVDVYHKLAKSNLSVQLDLDNHLPQEILSFLKCLLILSTLPKQALDEASQRLQSIQTNITTETSSQPEKEENLRESADEFYYQESESPEIINSFLSLVKTLPVGNEQYDSIYSPEELDNF